MDLEDIMIKVSVLDSPLEYKLVNGIVFVYGGCFKVDGEILDLNNNDDVIFKCLDLNTYELDFSDYPNVLCSKNLYKKRRGIANG